jgi:outer membrane murein-binding lipoprotein Lpp
MKIMIFLAALTIPLMAGIMLTGYQSSTQKKEAVRTKMQDVNKDLNAVQKDTNSAVQKVITAEEWKTFSKSDFELKIKSNEMRITELNIKIRKPAELFDAFYIKKIAALEEENRFLKSRLVAYEKSQSKMGNN